ncbi:acyltransferase [Bifidobacterium imperatoris]|uniref:Acyltransferase n=1 Tax=Bifidobacterium imperatoris TaxID=2020965 RepID=A0A2N5IRG2_9BIFI|nr:acyltransferase [Bifidobacterium imperatoris]PLS24542.1 exopolysaccharide biosynthesis protein [Bifidobacterium imperatoris]QSY58076.1 acyltransferase [Bifidobacterium imperatoris]
MLFLKIWYRVTGFFTLAFFKLLYGRNFQHGKAFHVRAGFHVSIEDNGTLHVGDDVFFNNYCSVNVRSDVTIGDGTIFGENVHIYDHNHRYGNPFLPIKEQGYTQAPIHIGAHCWIGTNTVILKGVTIGDNVVAGAGCVIYKDIPSNTIIMQNGQVHSIIATTKEHLA